MSETTPWFPVSINPVYAGWYDYRGPNWEEARVYWNGHAWGYWVGRNFVHMGEESTDEWRNLSASPRP